MAESNDLQAALDEYGKLSFAILSFRSVFDAAARLRQRAKGSASSAHAAYFGSYYARH